MTFNGSYNLQYSLEKIDTSCESNRIRWRNCLFFGVLFMLWFIALEKVLRNRRARVAFVKENYLQIVFVSKKAPILCFPSDQRNATCTLRHLEVVLQKPRSKQFCEVVSMLVILTMFRSSFTGSVIRYEQFFHV